jgi:hypothetical protein
MGRIHLTSARSPPMRSILTESVAFKLISGYVMLNENRQLF